jgi:hypothetical protein
MSKDQRYWIIGIGFFLIAILVNFIFWQISNEKNEEYISSIVGSYVTGVFVNNEDNNSEQIDWGDGQVVQNSTSTVKVPGVGEEIPEDLKDVIAVPDEVVQSAPGVDSNIRIFKIRGEGNKFIPSQIIVNYKDTVHIDLVAVDKNYDIMFPAYGMRQTAKQGEEKVLEFQANSEGRFIYYCESCGGIESEAKGYITVVK